MGKQPKDEADVRGVQSVEVGLGILLPFLTAAEPLKLSELAERAGVAAAQAHAYLVSFRRLGLVEQEPQTGRYQLGPAALQLAIARMQSFDPFHAAATVVEALRDAVGLTVTLAVWGPFGPTVITLVSGEEQVYINTRVGTVYSATGTATGLAFAAHLPEAIVRAAVERERLEPPSSLRVGRTRGLGSLAKEFQLTRERGFATIDPKPVPGIAAIAAPIFDHLCQVRMVMTLIGTERNPGLQPGSAAVGALLRATRRLSFELGCMGDAPA